MGSAKKKTKQETVKLDPAPEQEVEIRVRRAPDGSWEVVTVPVGAAGGDA